MFVRNLRCEMEGVIFDEIQGCLNLIWYAILHALNARGDKIRFLTHQFARTKRFKYSNRLHFPLNFYLRKTNTNEAKAYNSANSNILYNEKQQTIYCKKLRSKSIRYLYIVDGVERVSYVDSRAFTFFSAFLFPFVGRCVFGEYDESYKSLTVITCGVCQPMWRILVAWTGQCLILSLIY